MKAYIVDNEELTEQNRPLIKVYQTIEAANTALANGQLREGELVTTVFKNGAQDVGMNEELILDRLDEIEALIPESAGGGNVLVTLSQLTADFEALSSRLDANSTSSNRCLSASSVDNRIAVVTGKMDANASSSNKVLAESTIDNKIATAKTAVEADITAINNKIESTASSSNKLMSESTVDSKISTAVGAVDDKIDTTASSSNRALSESSINSKLASMFSLSGTTLTITLP